MESTHSPYLKHIYICVNKRDPGVTCCSHGGGEGIREKLKAFVKANGLKGKVRVSQSGCMDLCAQGPNVMVYPDHRWYHHVTGEDVDRIIEEHLVPLLAPARGSNGSVEAFLFDLGNVLVRFNHMAAVQKIAAKTKVTPEELFRFIFDSPLVVAHDEGKISTKRFYEGLKEAVGLLTSYDEFLEVWNNIFTLDSEMSSLVGRLASRYPCYLISNTNRPHFEYCRERYPVLDELHGWILSYEVGVLKPDPKIYHRALELARVPPSQILYIDDREDLVEAGRGMGFQVHRFTGMEPLLEDLKARGFKSEIASGFGFNTARSG